MDAAEEQHAAERVAAQGRTHIVGGVRAHGAAHGAGRLVRPVPLLVHLHGKQQVDRRALEARLLDELHPGGLVRRHDGVAGGILAGEELVVALHIHVGRLGEARIVAAGEQALVGHDGLAEGVQLDAQVLALDELGRKPDELAHLDGQLVLLFRSDGVARDEGATVLLIDELPGAVEPLELVDAGAGLAEVVGRGGVDRQHAHVVQVVARKRRRVIENGGLLDDAGQCDAALAEHAHEHRVAHGAVGLAVQVQRRVPTLVSGEPLGDAAHEGVSVAVDAPDLLRVVALGHLRVAGAHGVQVHQVGRGQKRVGIVLGLRGAGQLLDGIDGHATRAQAADVDHGRRAARAAVPAEGDGAIGLVGRIAYIGEGEHVPDERAVVGVQRQHLGSGGVFDGLFAVSPGHILAGRLRNGLLWFGALPVVHGDGEGGACLCHNGSLLALRRPATRSRARLTTLSLHASPMQKGHGRPPVTKRGGSRGRIVN